MIDSDELGSSACLGFYVSGSVIKIPYPPWLDVLWELRWFRLRRTGKADREESSGACGERVAAK